MSLESLGQELRQQRLSRGISIADIAAETRIHPRFLEAIEEGKFALLPQAYVRAFVREYASMVGLDPAETMLRYDEARGEKPSSPPQHPGGKPLLAAPEPPAEQERSFTAVQRQVVMGLLLIGAAAVAAYLLMSARNPLPAAVQEIPFDQVVRETEAAAIRTDTVTPAVSESSVVAAVQLPDSLRLEILTTDSVWMSITSDNRKTEQYLMGPNRRRQWAAKDQFVISMGNAGGAVFRVNGRDIGSLGRRGGVVRNVVINESTIKPQ